MKKYKYQMRQMGLSTSKIIKILLLLVIIGLLIRFAVGSCSKVKVSDSVMSYIGKTVCSMQMPVNSYIENVDTEAEPDLISQVVGGLYPVNSYIDINSSNIYIADYKESQPDNVTDDTSGDTLSAQAETQPQTQAPQPEQTQTEAPQAQTPQANGDGEDGDKIDVSSVLSNNVITGTVYPKSNLQDYNFIYKNFYTVTSITSLTDDMLRPTEFLEKDMTVAHDNSSPQILIFHTHSQEAFSDSVEGDPDTSIVGVGTYLTEILEQKYGLNVIHDTSVYDLVDGKLDRSKAYTYSEEGVQKILDQYPSIDVVIDLHRDGVADTTHLVTDVNGKQTAKIMFFNGLSYSNMNGPISYLSNPYRDDNLAMSLQMQLLGNAYYPGFLRRIYCNAYRYCLHMRGKSMLIEAGAQTNTYEEVKNAMEPLADILNKLLTGEKAY